MKKVEKAGKIQFKENIELALVDNATGEIIEKEVVSNTVVNTGLEALAKLINGVSTDNFTVIAIGTGSTAVSNGDTALETEVTRASATCTYEADYKAKYQKTFTFGSGEAYDITELGIFDSVTASGSVMLNRVVFSAKSVNSDISLVVTGTITVARA
jgi:hypothetical protein